MAQISLASAVFNATLSEAILYGIYVAIFAIAMFLLLTRERTKVTIWMTVVTLFMFLLASAHMVMVMRYATIEYLEKDAALEGNKILQHRGDILVYVPILLEVINFYVADAVVFWRAWVLWGKTWRSLAVPVVMWLVGVAGGIGQVNALAVRATTKTSASTWSLISAASTCASNFWAVGMIGYRYYIYHKEVIAVLGRRRANYRTLLVLIIESGLLYCSSLLLYIFLFIFAERGVYLIVYRMLAQLTAIYPTMIIVVVCLRLTQQDDIERFYTSIHYASSSTAFSGDPPSTRGPAPTVEVLIPSSPGLGEPKGMKEACDITQPIELNDIRSIHGSYTSPVDIK